MGRELRRKQAKKEGKSLKKEIPTEENQLKKLALITLFVILIICIIYIFSAVFITKELSIKESTATSEKEKLVDNTILASEIFKQSEEEYYVYFYNYDEEDTTITTNISKKIAQSKVYNVDTSSALNKNYVSEESNKNAKKLSELKVKSPTVIKVIGEEIIAYYEGNEIINNLK